jgi:hypothetical protein
MTNWRKTLKKSTVAVLTVSMLLSGATAAFADGKGKDKDKNQGKGYTNSQKNNNGKNSDWVPPGLRNKVQIHITFDDLKSGEYDWALRYIASLASKKVFEGYDDGTFQPNKPISRIEAITAAVRLMGLRTQAESSEEMNSNLNFKDAKQIREKYPWATGYVAIAAENDLFMESDTMVQPEKESSRLWATMLLVKALKLDSEARSKMNTKLNFKDAKDIPAGSVGYVAVAIEKGLIDGYEDNTFRPNRPVTRAELAALLDRTGAQMPDYNNTTVSGTLSAVINNQVLTIEKDGKSQQYALLQDALILRKGIRANVSDLKVGDKVKVYVYNNQVTFVEVTEAVEEQAPISQTIDGTVTAQVNNNNVLTYVSNNQTKTLTVQSDTKIYRHGELVAATMLKTGDQIRVVIHNNQILFIIVTTAVDQNNQNFTVDGKFQSLSINRDGLVDTISITTAVYGGTQTRVYGVSSDVTIIGNPSLLQLNRDVQLKGTNNVVTSIEVK